MKFETKIFGYNKKEVNKYLERLYTEHEESLKKIMYEKFEQEKIIKEALLEKNAILEQKDDIAKALIRAMKDSKKIIQETQDIKMEKLAALNKEVSEHRTRNEEIKRKSIEELNKIKNDIQIAEDELLAVLQMQDEEQKKLNKMNEAINTLKNYVEKIQN